MEDLLREILAPSPTIPSAPLPVVHPNFSSRSRSQSASGPEITPSIRQAVSTTPAGASPSVTIPTTGAADWEGHAEMQRLLDMLPNVQPDAGAGMDSNADALAFPSALDLELDGWDLDGNLGVPLGQEIGVF